ncbi:hypothetical protein ATANTOWER_026576 [Ataeniobius toweri]|uniref:LAGLIDADG homing endonuclease n=1 Tax=Ataeniobius toweri TaxID=208326 RepID=A0ABU7C0V9_9TELE|nr:hypothetical protein [Ataeniobius toweri]
MGGEKGGDMQHKSIGHLNVLNQPNVNIKGNMSIYRIQFSNDYFIYQGKKSYSKSTPPKVKMFTKPQLEPLFTNGKRIYGTAVISCCIKLMQQKTEHHITPTVKDE